MQLDSPHAYASRRPPTRRKSRYTFFVLRKHTSSGRKGSVSRKQSLRRADSSVNYAKFGSSADRSSERPIKVLDRVREPEQAVPEEIRLTERLQDQVTASVEREERSPQVISSPQERPLATMFATGETPLPPLPSVKDGLFKRLTTKLQRPHPPVLPQRASTLPSHPVPLAAVTRTSTSHATAESAGEQRRKPTLKFPPLPKPQAPRSTRINEFTSVEHREAALRARGLVPARYRDQQGFTIPLSQQESRMDQRFSVLVREPLQEGDDDDTEAQRIREAWLKRNVDSEVAEKENEHQGVQGEDNAAVMHAPMVPQLVNEHTPPPLSPSRPEYGDALLKRSSEQRTVDSVATSPTTSPLSVQSTRGSEVEVKVSEWLRRTPTTTPTKDTSRVLSGKGCDEDENNDFLPTPTSASLSTTRRKEKPLPIVAPGSEPDTSSSRSILSSILPPVPLSPPPELDDPRSPRNPSTPLLAACSPALSRSERGRAVIPVAQSSSLSTVPALSPTRTFSSATSESPQTPTGEFATSSSPTHVRKPSVASRGSHSSEGATPGAFATKTRDGGNTPLTSAVATVIVESPVEDGITATADVSTSDRLPVSTEHVEHQRTGMFARRMDRGPPPSKSAHAVASMSNLRSVAGTISSKLHLRPKSAIVVDSATAARESRSRGSGISHSSTMPIPRARQPLSPTMHNRASILLQAGAIEDEESRRLSELAFLDY